MNRAYRIIWNAALGLFQVVSELTKSHSGTTRSSIVSNNGTVIQTRRKPLARAVAMALLAMPALFAAHSAQAQVFVNGGINGTDYTITSDTPPNLTVTGTITAITAIVNNGSSIGTITNSGAIRGSYAGIGNTGTIGLLSNSGTISGAYGIINGDTIGTLIDAGSITTSANNISIANGTTLSDPVLSVDNLGVITTAIEAGIYNNATGVTITNAGTILGGSNLAISGNTAGTLLNVGIYNDSAGSIVSITNTGAIIGTNIGIDNAGGIIGLISNAGLSSISGGDYGIYNTSGNGTLGIIGVLANNGVIGGSITGVWNDGLIGALTNSGTISGFVGVGNDGSINTLTNASGGIIIASSVGVWNDGAISTFDNAGSIGGGAWTGIGNLAGNIGILTNNGTIHGNGTGIYNSGVITVLSNGSNGKIIGGSTYGIRNDASGIIGTLTNSGSISSYYGISNSGTINTLINDSDINGSNYGILNDSAIGTLINSGTINGNSYGIYNAASATIDILINVGSIANANDNISIASGTTLLAPALVVQNDGVIHTAIEAGIYNNAADVTITNAGTISNGANLTITGTADVDTLLQYGIYNNTDGTINSFNNNGSILSLNAGIYNGGTIRTLTNTGFINATHGIENDGSIGTLTNSGYILDNNVIAIAAIYNTNFIDTLTNTGTIKSYNNAIINDGGTINTLTNSALGTISGSAIGIWNENSATIGTLANNGFIGTGATAIQNESTITLLDNTGSIGDVFLGIYNINTGIIDTLTNAGIISSTSNGTALDNDGTITEIDNSGTISGSSAIYNDGLIGTITSAGAIVSNHNGIYNSGTIDTISNTGTINNAYTAIVNNGGSIGTITNAGTISNGQYGIYNHNGGTIAAIVNNAGGSIVSYTVAISNIDTTSSIGAITNTGVISGGWVGIYNQGTIDTIANTGLITGSSIDALYNTGTIGVITNTGVVAGNIYSSSSADLTIDGGDINDTIYGVLTGYGDTDGTGAIGTITNTSSNLVFGGNLILNDDINVGTYTATNSGVLALYNAITITGNYYQDAGAMLEIAVNSGAVTTTVDSNSTITTGSGYGRLIVTGDTTIESNSSSNASINIVSRGYALAAGQHYAVIDTEGTASYDGGTTLLTHGSTSGGDVTTLIYAATGYTATGADVTDASSGDHVLIVTLGAASGTSIGVGSASSGNWPSNISVLTALTSLPINVTSVGINDLRNALLSELGTGGSSVTSLSNQLNPSQVTNPDQFFASSAGALKSLVGHLNAGSDDSASGVTTGDGVAEKSIWLQGYGGHMNQDARDGFDHYSGNYGGFLLGTDKTVGQVQLGAAFNYSHSLIKDQALSGDKLDVDSYGVLGYATYQGSPWVVHGVGGFIWQSVDSSRVVTVSGVSNNLSGNFDGQQFLLHLDAGYPFVVGSGIVLTPLAGLTGVHLHNDAYTESGGGAALKVSNSTAGSFRSQLGMSVAKSWETSFGKITPDASLQWVHEYESAGIQLHASFVDGGSPTAFVVNGQTPVKNFADLGIGVTFVKSDTLSFTARYELQDGNGFTSNTGSLKGVYKF